MTPRWPSCCWCHRIQRSRRKVTTLRWWPTPTVWVHLRRVHAKPRTTRRPVPVEDHSCKAGLGEDHFPRVELFGGPQASTFAPGIKQLGSLHVPYSHCAGQTKHTGDSEEGESSRGRDRLRECRTLTNIRVPSLSPLRPTPAEAKNNPEGVEPPQQSGKRGREVMEVWGGACGYPLFGSVPPVVFWSGAAVAVCHRHMTGNSFSDFIFAFYSRVEVTAPSLHSLTHKRRF